VDVLLVLELDELEESELGASGGLHVFPTDRFRIFPTPKFQLKKLKKMFYLLFYFSMRIITTFIGAVRTFAFS
jgi:hypothetical protein